MTKTSNILDIVRPPMPGILKNLICSGMARAANKYKNIEKTVENKKDTPLIGFCGGPLTTFLFMFRGDENQKGFKNAIKFFYNNRKQSLRIIEQITEASILYAQNQVKSGIQCFQLFETYCGSIPYELYENCILPYSKKILNSAKELGCPTIFFPKDFVIIFKLIFTH